MAKVNQMTLPGGEVVQGDFEIFSYDDFKEAGIVYTCKMTLKENSAKAKDSYHPVYKLRARKPFKVSSIGRIKYR